MKVFLLFSLFIFSLISKADKVDHESLVNAERQCFLGDDKKCAKTIMAYIKIQKYNLASEIYNSECKTNKRNKVCLAYAYYTFSEEEYALSIEPLKLACSLGFNESCPIIGMSYMELYRASNNKDYHVKALSSLKRTCLNKQSQTSCNLAKLYN